MLAKILLRALLLTLTPKTVALAVDMLLDMLREFSEKTENEIDDKIYQLFRDFTDRPEVKKELD